jgi:error-prone DNA polymerase
LRRHLLWELGKLRYQEEELDLAFPDDGVELLPLSRAEALADEVEVLGLSTGEHVMALYRPWLVKHGILGSRELEASLDGQRVRVAGLVVVHQAPPTAKGHHFVTLEDAEGLINAVVRPAVYAQYRRTLHTALLLIVEGMAQRNGGVTNLFASRIAEMEHKGQP